MAKLDTEDVTQLARVTSEKFSIRSKSVLISVEIMTVPRHLDIAATQAGLEEALPRGCARFAGVRIETSRATSLAYIHAMQNRYPGE